MRDIFQPHNEHWVTLPLLAYRAVWNIVGLSRYWPYQVMSVAAHLACAALLRVIMRRSGVHPWIATAAATLFVLLGAGRANIAVGFQITLVGSVGFGLAQLLLADHDGPITRRDAVGLGCGLAGLMCSGIGVPMVVAVGMATLLRRGWRTALFHTVPLAVAFGGWWVTFGGRSEYAGSPTVVEVLNYVGLMFGYAVAGFGQVRFIGLTVVIVAIVGLVWLRRSSGIDAFRREAAVPLAMAMGSLVLAFTVAVGRVGRVGAVTPESSRYVYLLVAMLLPAIALGLSTVAKHHRGMTLVTVALLLVGLPGNIRAFEMRGNERLELGSRDLVLSGIQVAAHSRAPSSLEPFVESPLLTMGQIRRFASSGKIPDAPASQNPAIRGDAILATTLFHVPTDTRKNCRHPQSSSMTISLADGEVLRVVGNRVNVGLVLDGQTTASRWYPRPSAQRQPLDLSISTELKVFEGPIELRLLDLEPGQQAALCRS